MGTAGAVIRVTLPPGGPTSTLSMTASFFYIPPPLFLELSSFLVSEPLKMDFVKVSGQLRNRIRPPQVYNYQQNKDRDFFKACAASCFRCGTASQYLNRIFVKHTLMLCKHKLCKMRWGAKQIYYATCFFNPRLEAADAVELLYCTGDKVNAQSSGRLSAFTSSPARGTGSSPRPAPALPAPVDTRLTPKCPLAQS